MRPRFKLDENLPLRLESTLRGLGHDVDTAVSEGLAGSSDPRLLAACTDENRLLVALDLDFADIQAYPPGTHEGISVLRPPTQSAGAIVDVALAGIRLASIERTAGQLWIIDGQRVRIRE